VPEHPVYSIGAVAQMIGVSVGTIRTWEDRYGVVVPERTGGGHRLYQREHLERLRYVRDRVAVGIAPGNAFRELEHRLRVPDEPPGRDRARDVDVLILVAERDPYAADFAEFFLKTEGYSVTVVTQAERALVQVRENPPDLVIVDLQISGGIGLRLCRQLREQLKSPILAISTLSMRDDALEAGAAAFLRKPLSPLHLISAVQDLLGRSAFLRPGEDRS
jgi:CheY-like chemotaxis protein